jgi:hypothetical protein
MAEKNGWPFSLLGHMQGDAIRGDVGLLDLWAVDPCETIRPSHATQQKACTYCRTAS